MKKLLAMVMAVAMTLSLAACGGNSTPAASGLHRLCQLRRRFRRQHRL